MNNEVIDKIKNLSQRLKADMNNQSLAASLKIHINKLERFTACGCDPWKILAKSEEIIKNYDN